MRSFLLILGLGLATACAADSTAQVTAALAQALGDQPVTAALDTVLCGDPATLPCTGRVSEVWADVRTFYVRRSGRPVWVDHQGPTLFAAEALEALRRAAEHGLTPDDYGASALAAVHEKLTPRDERSPATPAELADFEAQLTAALLGLGRDVAIGRLAPGGRLRMSSRRATPDVAARLSACVEANDLRAWPDDVRPAHAEYAALQQVLASMRRDGAAGSAGAGAIAGAGAVEAPAAGATTKVDAVDERADRMRRIALNLERWRWLPDDLGARHVLVNIPQFHLFVRERGRSVLDFRVIVGKRGDETPVFSAEMSTVVFSPYWTIPESIAIGETVPSIRRDATYLARNQIDVLRLAGGRYEVVDPATIDWKSPAATRGLVLRQRPGSGNALGHVKFVFPNPYAVFMHDTPGHDLFERSVRAFSHGCIRLQQPFALARYLLAGNPEWSDEAIRTAMRSGTEREVDLGAPVPVHIVYFTVWVDPAGAVQFLDDVYRYDGT